LLAPTGSQLTDFLRLVNEPSSLPVYVHCKGGRHRTGVMTAIYRMEKDGWTGDKAFKEMKQYNFGMDILHPEFKSFVLRYKPTNLAAATAVTNCREIAELTPDSRRLRACARDRRCCLQLCSEVRAEPQQITENPSRS